MNRIEWLRELERAAEAKHATGAQMNLMVEARNALPLLLDLAEATRSFEAFAEVESGYKDGMTLFEHEEFWSEISTLREKLLPLLEEVESDG